MSCRPRGPSERPHFYHDVDFLEAQANAPRLQGQSIASKLVVGALLLCCCGIVAFCALFIASLWAQIPHMPTAAAVGPGAAVVSIEHRGDRPPRHHAQRSVLHRLAMLRRAHPPERGVDRASVRTAFPQWLGGDAWDLDVVVGDVLLALSYLAQGEEEYERGGTGSDVYVS